MSRYSSGRTSHRPQSTSVLYWLNALVCGLCSQREFLERLQRLEVDDPYVAWELLQVAGQHFSRNRISREVAEAMAARFEPHVRGLRRTAEPAAPSRGTGASSTSKEPLCRRPMLQEGAVLHARYRIVSSPATSESPVYKAIDEYGTGSDGATATVTLEVAGAAGFGAEKLRQGIERTRSLSHPGIERIRDVFEEDSTLYLVRDHEAGIPLRQLIDQQGGRLQDAAAMGVLRSVARALAHAHSHKVCHGDVTVENIRVSAGGRVALRDFEWQSGTGTESDCIGFAWLAYRMLSDQGGSLRAPAALSRAEWHVLRNTLIGNVDEGVSRILATFASDPAAQVRVAVEPRKKYGGVGRLLRTIRVSLGVLPRARAQTAVPT